MGCIVFSHPHVPHTTVVFPQTPPFQAPIYLSLIPASLPWASLSSSTARPCLICLPGPAQCGPLSPSPLSHILFLSYRAQEILTTCMLIITLMFFLHTPSTRSFSTVVLQFKHYFLRDLFLSSLLKYSLSFSFSSSSLILYGSPFGPFTHSLYHPVAHQFIPILAHHHLDSFMYLSVSLLSVPLFRMYVP